MDWPQIIRDIEDHLFPGLALNAWEKSLYYHLLRHTRLEGRERGIFSIESLAASTGISDWKTRDAFRSLERKGAVIIIDRSRKGHMLKVVIPSEIPNLQSEMSVVVTDINIEDVDLFTGRKYLTALLARESDRCFYCLSAITPETCVLDHVVAQVNGLDNSYRNVVASCHNCNSLKQENSPDNFLRGLYRRGLLSPAELEDRLQMLSQLQSGGLVPVLP
jgi:predicted transcriptional regulator